MLTRERRRTMGDRLHAEDGLRLVDDLNGLLGGELLRLDDALQTVAPQHFDIVDIEGIGQFLLLHMHVKIDKPVNSVHFTSAKRSGGKWRDEEISKPRRRNRRREERRTYIV